MRLEQFIYSRVINEIEDSGFEPVLWSSVDLSMINSCEMLASRRISPQINYDVFSGGFGCFNVNGNRKCLFKVFRSSVRAERGTFFPYKHYVLLDRPAFDPPGLSLAGVLDAIPAPRGFSKLEPNALPLEVSASPRRFEDCLSALNLLFGPDLSKGLELLREALRGVVLGEMVIFSGVERDTIPSLLEGVVCLLPPRVSDELTFYYNLKGKGELVFNEQNPRAFEVMLARMSIARSEESAAMSEVKSDFADIVAEIVLQQDFPEVRKILSWCDSVNMAPGEELNRVLTALVADYRKLSRDYAAIFQEEGAATTLPDLGALEVFLSFLKRYRGTLEKMYSKKLLYANVVLSFLETVSRHGWEGAAVSDDSWSMFFDLNDGCTLDYSKMNLETLLAVHRALSRSSVVAGSRDRFTLKIGALLLDSGTLQDNDFTEVFRSRSQLKGDVLPYTERVVDILVTAQSPVQLRDFFCRDLSPGEKSQIVNSLKEHVKSELLPEPDALRLVSLHKELNLDTDACIEVLLPRGYNSHEFVSEVLNILVRHPENLRKEEVRNYFSLAYPLLIELADGKQRLDSWLEGNPLKSDFQAKVLFVAPGLHLKLYNSFDKFLAVFSDSSAGPDKAGRLAFLLECLRSTAPLELNREKLRDVVDFCDYDEGVYIISKHNWNSEDFIEYLELKPEFFEPFITNMNKRPDVDIETAAGCVIERISRNGAMYPNLHKFVSECVTKSLITPGRSGRFEAWLSSKVPAELLDKIIDEVSSASMVLELASSDRLSMVGVWGCLFRRLLKLSPSQQQIEKFLKLEHLKLSRKELSEIIPGLQNDGQILAVAHRFRTQLSKGDYQALFDKIKASGKKTELVCMAIAKPAAISLDAFSGLDSLSLRTVLEKGLIGSSDVENLGTALTVAVSKDDRQLFEKALQLCEECDLTDPLISLHDDKADWYVDRILAACGNNGNVIDVSRVKATCRKGLRSLQKDNRAFLAKVEMCQALGRNELPKKERKLTNMLLIGLILIMLAGLSYKAYETSFKNNGAGLSGVNQYRDPNSTLVPSRTNGSAESGGNPAYEPITTARPDATVPSSKATTGTKATTSTGKGTNESRKPDAKQKKEPAAAKKKATEKSGKASQSQPKPGRPAASTSKPIQTAPRPAATKKSSSPVAPPAKALKMQEMTKPATQQPAPVKEAPAESKPAAIPVPSSKPVDTVPKAAVPKIVAPTPQPQGGAPGTGKGATADEPEPAK